MGKQFFDELMKDYEQPNEEKFRVHLGETEIGQVVELGARQMGHTLISGMSQAGKSTMTKHIMRSIVAFGQVAVYSPKSQDYVEFHEGAYITSDMKKFGAVIRKAVGTLERRNKASLIKSMQAGCTVNDDNAPIYIVIDEFRTFIESCDKATDMALKRLVAEGAGLNIFLILIAQTAHKKIFSDGLKDSMMTLIAFKARDTYASRAAILSRKAEYIELRQCIVKNVDKEWLITDY